MGVHIELPKLPEKYKDFHQAMMLELASVMQTNRGMIFNTSGTYNGRPGWAALKVRIGGMPLKDTGTLSRSIGPFANGKPVSNAGTILETRPDLVTVGTNLHYARLMNDGTMKMSDGAMKRVSKNGKEYSIRIPARPFDDITMLDIEEFIATVKNFIERGLNE